MPHHGAVPAAPGVKAAPSASGPVRPALIGLPGGGTTCLSDATSGTTGNPGCDTTATFTVNVGTLQITVPTGTPLAPVVLGAGDTATAIIGPLGDVTVTDNRGELAPVWTASVVSSDFVTGAGVVGTAGPENIPATDVSYWCGPVVGTPTATSGTVFTPGQPTGTDDTAGTSSHAIGTTQTAYSLTSGAIGDNQLTWDPTITVDVPTTAVAGTYLGTITHSVA